MALTSISLVSNASEIKNYNFGGLDIGSIYENINNIENNYIEYNLSVNNNLFFLPDNTYAIFDKKTKRLINVENNKNYDSYESCSSDKEIISNNIIKNNQNFRKLNFNPEFKTDFVVISDSEGLLIQLTCVNHDKKDTLQVTVSDSNKKHHNNNKIFDYKIIDSKKTILPFNGSAYINKQVKHSNEYNIIENIFGYQLGENFDIELNKHSIIDYEEKFNTLYLNKDNNIIALEIKNNKITSITKNSPVANYKECVNNNEIFSKNIRSNFNAIVLFNNSNLLFKNGLSLPRYSYIIDNDIITTGCSSLNNNYMFVSHYSNSKINDRAYILKNQIINEYEINSK